MAVSTRRMEDRFPVRNIQIALQALSEAHPTIVAPIPDGIYGPVTEAAVAEYQRIRGLSASGVTDAATWDALHRDYFQWLHQRTDPSPVPLFPRDEAHGETMPDGEDAVYALQLMLRRLARNFADFIPVAVTGELDNDTARELRRFQSRSLLPETGTLDRTTWDQLVRLYRLLADWTIEAPAQTS